MFVRGLGIFAHQEPFEAEVVVKKVTYRNEITGYVIADVKACEKGAEKKFLQETKIKGIFPLIFEGDVFEVLVSVELNQRHGYTLNTVGVPTLKAVQLEKEVIQFIDKRVKGVSKKTATEIVSHFGIDCLKKITENKEILFEIPKMTQKKADKIYEAAKKQEEFDALLEFVKEHQIEPSLINKIFMRFDENPAGVLKNNPYMLLTVGNVDFRQADDLARRLGVKYNDDIRIVNLIHGYLDDLARSQGSLYANYIGIDDEINKFARYKGAYPNHEDIWITEYGRRIFKAYQNAELAIDDGSGSGNHIYTKYFYDIENNIVSKITDMVKREKEWAVSKDLIEEVIVKQEEKQGFELDALQKKAVYMALSNMLSILTGGPGTGKTQTTNMIVQTIETLIPGASILLLAPTGKAAKRMTELTGKPASTIHRAIGYFEKDSEQGVVSLEADFVIIDESSMIDAIILSDLLDSIRQHTRVILVGDFEQLPSVGPGLILRDFIESKRIPTTKLTTIFRQAQESQIVMNSHAIIKGKVNEISIDHNKEDFFFIEQQDLLRAKALIIASVMKMIHRYGFSVDDICVLSPMKKGELGIEALNQALQEAVNPYQKGRLEMYAYGARYRIGDKVMHLKNDSEKELVNGEVGYVVDIEENAGAYFMYVKYPDHEKPVLYSKEDCEQVTLCYAMSIHKSQGSEFPIVIMPVHPSHGHMLSRNLIYTGITRCKKKIVIVGDSNVLRRSVTREEIQKRISGVKPKLMESLPLIEDDF